MWLVFKRIAQVLIAIVTFNRDFITELKFQFKILTSFLGSFSPSTCTCDFSQMDMKLATALTKSDFLHHLRFTSEPNLFLK